LPTVAHPHIQMLDFVEGAKQSTGLTVIIDVFRAFSVACYVVANGAERVIPVGSLEAARRLAENYPDSILIGERDGRKVPGFAYNNSPTEIEAVDFQGQTIIHTTTNGTQGLVNAPAANEVLTGGFVNAGALVAYIQRQQSQLVSLVAMGSSPGHLAEEDTACAVYLKAALEGKPLDFETIKQLLRYSYTGRKFFDPAEEWAIERDFELCLQLSRFDFVLRRQIDRNGKLSLQKIEV